MRVWGISEIWHHGLHLTVWHDALLICPCHEHLYPASTYFLLSYPTQYNVLYNTIPNTIKTFLLKVVQSKRLLFKCWITSRSSVSDKRLTLQSLKTNNQSALSYCVVFREKTWVSLKSLKWKCGRRDQIKEPIQDLVITHEGKYNQPGLTCFMHTVGSFPIICLVVYGWFSKWSEYPSIAILEMQCKLVFIFS